jgi:predicted ATPase
MRIHRLALKNFKCFKEVDVSFSKITLLTGENSSGKSSLIYGILSPLQSLNLYGDSFPLYLSFNGDYVNMGGFEDVSFNHNLKNNLMIDLSMSFQNTFTTDSCNFKTFWHFDKISNSPKFSSLSISAIGDIKKRDDSPSHIVDIQMPNRLKYSNSDYIDYDNILYDFEISTYFEYASELSDELNRDLINNFNFISAFRSQPERTYYQSLTSNKVDKFGGGYIYQILDWGDNQSEELFDLISILKDLNITHDLKPHKLSGGRFDIKVKVKNKSKWESLPDVGFGISQFLPIIVADLQLVHASTLVMSQPEIHLHPSVQANLGNYLVKQVKEKNKNYIVETHSEYLLNRMRLLIVKGEIQPEDVAVYYFENSIKDGSVAHRIEFTKDGRILNAPKGFFETYMIDTMDIALNA